MIDLIAAERKIFSQNGEDGVIAALLEALGLGNAAERWCVEFGVGDGAERNTRLLAETGGYQNLLIDVLPLADAHRLPNVRYINECVTAENAVGILELANVPIEFDLLSIDLDGNDFYVWQALAAKYRPRIVVIEVNSSLDSADDCVVPYDPSHHWDNTAYFGASPRAMTILAQSLRYEFVFMESELTNAFFVRNDLIGQISECSSKFPVYEPRHRHPSARRSVRYRSASRRRSARYLTAGEAMQGMK